MVSGVSILKVSIFGNWFNWPRSKMGLHVFHVEYPSFKIEITLGFEPRACQTCPNFCRWPPMIEFSATVDIFYMVGKKTRTDKHLSHVYIFHI